MSYDTYAQALCRTPVTVVAITLDKCSRVFGAGLCTATGAACYNTYETCKNRAVYLKSSQVLYFINHDLPACLDLNERPYLQSITYLPTDISQRLTITGRVKAVCLDEPDTDVGIDPYLSTRTPPILGTYWRKLLARNPNYKGRAIQIYEGFLGLPWNEFQLRWQGQLYNIKLDKGRATIEAIDPLKALADYYLPAKVDLKLTNNISSTVTSFSVNKSSLLSTCSNALIDDEAIQINSVSSIADTIDVSRGALGTTPTSHLNNCKITPMWIIEGNPFTVMQTLLQIAIPVTSINTTAFDHYSTWPVTEPNVYGIITEPTPVNDLYFELVDLTNCKSWYAEDQRVTITRLIKNDPKCPFIQITDNAHIIDSNISIDLQSNNFITRCSFWWGKALLGDVGHSTSYSYLQIAVDAEAESSVAYDAVLSTDIYCRWWPNTTVIIADANIYADCYSGRKLFFNRDPLKLLQLKVELKDSTILTGQRVQVITNDCQDIYGAPIELQGMVTKREVIGEGELQLTVQELHRRYIMIIASTTVGDWTACSEAERIANGFLGDSQNYMPDGLTLGYHMY